MHENFERRLSSLAHIPQQQVFLSRPSFPSPTLRAKNSEAFRAKMAQQMEPRNNAAGRLEATEASVTTETSIHNRTNSHSRCSR